MNKLLTILELSGLGEELTPAELETAVKTADSDAEKALTDSLLAVWQALAPPEAKPTAIRDLDGSATEFLALFDQDPAVANRAGKIFLGKLRTILAMVRQPGPDVVRRAVEDAPPPSPRARPERQPVEDQGVGSRRPTMAVPDRDVARPPLPKRPPEPPTRDRPVARDDEDGGGRFGFIRKAVSGFTSRVDLRSIPGAVIERVKPPTDARGWIGLGVVFVGIAVAVYVIGWVIPWPAETSGLQLSPQAVTPATQSQKPQTTDSSQSQSPPQGKSQEQILAELQAQIDATKPDQPLDTSVKLPQLVTTTEPWVVPHKLSDLWNDPNKFASWLTGAILIFAFLWSFKRERAKELPDYYGVLNAWSIWGVMAVFAPGIITMIAVPLAYLDIPIEIKSPDALIAGTGLFVVLMGVYRGIEGVLDLTPPAAASALVGMILVWAPHPESQLRQIGLLYLGLSMAIFVLESILKDPKGRKNRLGNLIFALLGLLAILLVKGALGEYLPKIIMSAVNTPETSTELKIILVKFGLPIAGLISLVVGVVVGAVVASGASGQLLTVVEKLVPGAGVSDDKWDAMSIMLLLIFLWVITHGTL